MLKLKWSLNRCVKYSQNSILKNTGNDHPILFEFTNSLYQYCASFHKRIGAFYNDWIQRWKKISCEEKVHDLLLHKYLIYGLYNMTRKNVILWNMSLSSNIHLHIFHFSFYRLYANPFQPFFVQYRGLSINPTVLNAQ